MVMVMMIVGSVRAWWVMSSIWAMRCGLWVGGILVSVGVGCRMRAVMVKCSTRAVML